MHSRFDYHRASSLEEACRLMAELPGAQILAGGTDLLVDVGTGIRQAENLISVRDLPELRQIRKLGDRIAVGAGCTAAQVEGAELVRRHFPELAEVVTVFASPQVRARATLGGNVCSAVPCCDFPPILMALGSEIELRRSDGCRVLPLREFFIGNRQTVRRSDEILTQILIPLRGDRAAASYQKFRRRASNSLAVASAAAFLELHGSLCRTARIVLGAVAPIPLFAEKAGTSLVGKAVDEPAIAAAAEIACQECRPITDQRATESYRRQLVQVLTARALREALRRTGAGRPQRQENHE
jgi:carbon-monoxide dehydrogenase medium subunit